MTYSVKEIFYTLQGEGANVGTPAVFCRFAGCNLWSGREEDRASAICNFCDTDFVGVDGIGGGKFATAAELAAAIEKAWPTDVHTRRFTVLTGGEPGLQLDSALITSLHQYGFRIAVETNGTVVLPSGIDWVCVSPKAETILVTTSGHELKLVYPQKNAAPELFEHMDFGNFFLSPMDGLLRLKNTALAIAYCQRHPKWRLSVQVHKLIGIP